ncbi:bifunctional nuclease family protein [Candidatus Bipolaricaulota bacterium]|nr:bifunctional nuclease family protein [Candidatus Bipolaricaulota bacterium]
MRELVVGGIAFDQESRAPILLLKDLVVPRYITLRIGAPEAMSILLHLQGTPPPRPFTHDLMKALLDSLGCSLDRVVLVDVVEGVCYAHLWLRLPSGKIRKVDARPSDSVALALRMGSPIFIEDDLFEELAQELPDIDLPPP